MWRLERELNP